MSAWTFLCGTSRPTKRTSRSTAGSGTGAAVTRVHRSMPTTGGHATMPDSAMRSWSSWGSPSCNVAAEAREFPHKHVETRGERALRKPLPDALSRFRITRQEEALGRDVVEIDHLAIRQ